MRKEQPKNNKIDNLKGAGFQPGKSGNPNGRPKGSISLVERLKKRLREHPEQIDTILDALFEQAINGSSKHLEIILDRIDGKVADKVEIVMKIQTEIIHRIGALLPQAMLQAGASKAQVAQGMENLQRLLESGE